MDNIVKMTIDSYLTIFDSYEIKDDTLKNLVEDFKNELFSLGEGISDSANFASKFMESGLQERYSSLITAVATASYTPQEHTESNKTVIPTVKEFVMQYSSSYEEIKKAGYRKRAEQAYENIFDVANRTDNMLDAQIILEKERLLWKIVREDMLDIYETILDAMDPLYVNITLPIKIQLKAWRQVDSDEEATYTLDILEKQKYIELEKENFRMMLPIILANLLIAYNSSKIEFRMWGSGGKSAKSGLISLIVLRENIKNTYKIFVEKFGYDYDKILEDEWLMIWLLVPSNLDEMGRIKMSLDPYNIEVFRDLLFNEILTDKPMEEILMVEQSKMFRYSLDKKNDEVVEKFTKEAEKINTEKTYFKYKETLKKFI